MFGTDWPVCLLRIDSYQAWAEMVRNFVANLTPGEADAVLHDNAARFYDLW
jgi:predicted TIM-barrel fold metal-dependent hydrolase